MREFSFRKWGSTNPKEVPLLVFLKPQSLYEINYIFPEMLLTLKKFVSQLTQRVLKTKKYYSYVPAANLGAANEARSRGFLLMV